MAPSPANGKFPAMRPDDEGEVVDCDEWAPSAASGPFSRALQEAHDRLNNAHCAVVATLEAELQHMRHENTRLRTRLGVLETAASASAPGGGAVAPASKLSAAALPGGAGTEDRVSTSSGSGKATPVCLREQPQAEGGLMEAEALEPWPALNIERETEGEGFREARPHAVGGAAATPASSASDAGESVDIEDVGRTSGKLDMDDSKRYEFGPADGLANASFAPVSTTQWAGGSPTSPAAQWRTQPGSYGPTVVVPPATTVTSAEMGEESLQPGIEADANARWASPATASDLHRELEAVLAHNGWTHLDVQHVEDDRWRISGVAVLLRVASEVPGTRGRCRLVASADDGVTWESFEDHVRRRRLQKVVRTAPIVTGTLEYTPELPEGQRRNSAPTAERGPEAPAAARPLSLKELANLSARAQDGSLASVSPQANASPVASAWLAAPSAGYASSAAASPGDWQRTTEHASPSAGAWRTTQQQQLRGWSRYTTQ